MLLLGWCIRRITLRRNRADCLDRQMNIALLIAVCIAVVGGVALIAITTDPRYREARRRSRQRRAINRLERALPEQLKKEKEGLCALWDSNPAARCAAIFNGFKRPAKKADSTEELADRVDRAIDAASSLFGQDFVSRYADLYGNRLVFEPPTLRRSSRRNIPIVGHSFCKYCRKTKHKPPNASMNIFGMLYLKEKEIES
jgi:hypothetical protein